MANTNKSGRRVHVSPGVYTSETELQYASKSLGITTLGLVGETKKGPAFQPILIEDWRQFQTYFGDTSTEKYRASQYPKYELPYIAKEYLKQSQQLQVCRVLGLSGVNAGPAWVISAYGTKTYKQTNPLVIAVIRSRGEHQKVSFVQKADAANNICRDEYEYDKLVYYAKDVKMVASEELTLGDGCTTKFTSAEQSFTINATNYGVFTLEVTLNDDTKKKYSVSLNPSDKNYIVNLLGMDPEVGSSEIYVEELYDVALQQLIERGELTTLKNEIDKFPMVMIIPDHAPVVDLMTADESTLTRRDLGKRFLFSAAESVNAQDNSKLKIHKFNKTDNSWTEADGEVGHIYTVRAYTKPDGIRTYYYAETVGEEEKLSKERSIDTKNIFGDAVEVSADGMYYVMNTDGTEVVPVTLDLNNYKEQFRYASTPWIVSELKGSAKNVELTKLFRFHTISDGKTANTEVKVSIENIDPENGTFDVIVRDFHDTDNSVALLERFKNCDLIPGSANYIAYKIGSFDESYEAKSKYITVEVNETDKTRTSIPAGFLGYPVRYWGGEAISKPATNLQQPYFAYNTSIDEDINIRKQYFGISNLTGIDEDILKYKGIEAYNSLPQGLSPCFHLDSRIISGKPTLTNGHYVSKDAEAFGDIEQIISVDGVEGYEWVTVGRENTTYDGIEPRIGNDSVMAGTIYEDKRYRKFTVAFYGGFDGWDYYRTYRSNTDDFKQQKYRGAINSISGEGVSVSVIKDPQTYGFDESAKIITSDYYAYLSGVRQFANPKTIDINVFATPGIDYVNNTMLVSDVIDMIEEERADSVYVVTTPDKPFGAGDSISEMFSPTDAVDNLEGSEIDSNYTCTFYPWVKVEDTNENQYIYLPVTKDIVRNFAYTDNTTYPWFAAAGWNRGDINGIKPRRNLKIGEQDELYDNRINFVNTFAQEGMKLWGDKNLQVHESQMNRISKRRLLLRLRKLCAIACIGLVFDPNDTTMGQTFKSAVKPILEDIRTKRGITDFRIEVDDSQEARDRLELPAKIYVKLQPNLEYIDINFVITPQGVSFDDI